MSRWPLRPVRTSRPAAAACERVRVDGRHRPPAGHHQPGTARQQAARLWSGENGARGCQQGISQRAERRMNALRGRSHDPKISACNTPAVSRWPNRTHAHNARKGNRVKVLRRKPATGTRTVAVRRGSGEGVAADLLKSVAIFQVPVRNSGGFFCSSRVNNTAHLGDRLLLLLPNRRLGRIGRPRACVRATKEHGHVCSPHRRYATRASA